MSSLQSLWSIWRYVLVIICLYTINTENFSSKQKRRALFDSTRLISFCWNHVMVGHEYQVSPLSNKYSSTEVRQTWEYFAWLSLLLGVSFNRDNFLHGSYWGAIFWICGENSVDNTGIFLLFLHSADKDSRPFLPLTLCHQWGGWESTRSWEATQLEQLILMIKGLFHTIWNQEQHCVALRVLYPVLGPSLQ